MVDQIKQIAERLKGLRESLDLSIEEMATKTKRKEDEIERSRDSLNPFSRSAI